MQSIQEVFTRLHENKIKTRQLTEEYKDALNSSIEYKELLEKIKGLKLRKKQIEEQVKEELGSTYNELEAAKKDAQLDKELLADIAINKLVSGEKVQVEDPHKNIYTPEYKVSFKKAKMGFGDQE